MSAKEPKHFGKRGHLTDEQKIIHAQFFRECNMEALLMARYSAEDPADTALRFLRSRKFLIPESKKLLDESMELRLNCKVKEYSKMTAEEAGDANVAVMKHFYPHGMAYHDKANKPIVWDASGRLNIDAISVMMDRQLLLGYHFWTMATGLDGEFTKCAKLSPLRPGLDIAASTTIVDVPALPSAATTTDSDAPHLPAASVAADGVGEVGALEQFSEHEISTFVVLDLDGLGMAQLAQKTLDQVKLYVSTDNVCYPETLGKMIIINAPWVLDKIWGMVKSWLDPRTVAKIEIIGSAEESMKRMRENVDDDNLPADYGGNAPRLFEPKPHTEYQLLPRGGEYSYELTVAADCPGLKIDTYVMDVPIDYTVEVRSHVAVSDQGKGEGVPAKKEKRGSWWGGKSKAASDAVTWKSLSAIPTIQVHKETLTLDPSNNRRRRLHKLSAAELGNKDGNTTLQLRLTWKNSAAYTRYPIVFSVTLDESDDAAGATWSESAEK